MKKTIYICLFALIAILLQSCDNLSDELFEKKVYLTKNEWVDVELNIPATGIIDFPVAVGVSGTSENDKNVTVKLAVDSAALSQYNFDKYRRDSLLYYTLLPEAAFTIPEELVITSGEDLAVAHLTIDMSKLTDLYADYVLPLKIESASNYAVSEEYAVGLYHIVFTNSFSGTYSGSISIADVQAKNGYVIGANKSTVANKTLYAISHDECFFYAGKYDRTNKERNKCIMTIKAGNSVEGSTTAKELVFSAVNPDLDMMMYPYEEGVEEGNYDYLSTIDYSLANEPTDNRYMQHTTINDISFTFMDVGLKTPARYRMQGKMSRIKKVLKSEL